MTSYNQLFSLWQHWLAAAGVVLLLAATTAMGAEPQRSCRPQKARLQHPVRRAASSYAQQRYTGVRHQLVILAAFSDQAFLSSDPLTQWNKIFNEENFSESPFYGSVHDYFLSQSYGQFQLSFDLQYVQLDESRVKYRSTRTDDENSKYLVIDLIEALQQRDIDWSLYDWDGDGLIEQLLIVYAGKGQNDGGGSNTIWPHQWWLSEHENVSPISLNDGQQTIDCYCCVQELGRTGGYTTFGTICHEYSHCFGLPDFYYGATSYIEMWDLMDYGNNGLGGYCPPNYSAHERMLMGWLTPTLLDAPCTISNIVPTSQEPQAFIIHNDAYPNEFYMVENRQKEAWDRSLPGSGIIVWHIDYDEDIWTTGMPNQTGQTRYTIIPANNRNSTYYASGWAYPYATNDQLTDTSMPAATLQHANTNGTMLMSKPITDMQVENGIASFSFMQNMTGISIHPLSARSSQLLYEFGPIRIVRQADGTLRKQMAKQRQ